VTASILTPSTRAFSNYEVEPRARLQCGAVGCPNDAHVKPTLRLYFNKESAERGTSGLGDEVNIDFLSVCAAHAKLTTVADLLTDENYAWYAEQKEKTGLTVAARENARLVWKPINHQKVVSLSDDQQEAFVSLNRINETHPRFIDAWQYGLRQGIHEPNVYKRISVAARPLSEETLAFLADHPQAWERYLHHQDIMGGAADAWKFYQEFRDEMAEGVMELDADAFFLALYLTAGNADTLTAATNKLKADPTSEHANNNGYTTGGKTLTTTWGISTDTATFDYTNSPVWTASAGSIVARFAVLWDDTPAVPLDPLVCMTTLDNTPLDVTVTDTNTLTVDANASGVFTMTGGT